MKIELTGVHYDISEKLHVYAAKKLNRLEKYVPRAARESAHAEVRLRQVQVKGVSRSTCEITLHLPHENLQATETTLNMYSAIDISTAHMQQQIAGYKEKYSVATLRHRLKRRFRSNTQNEE